MTSFAKARKIVSKRKLDRRIRDTKRKIEIRRGIRLACAILGRDEMGSNSHYTYTTWRRMWELNMAVGLASAFRNDPRWQKLSREQINERIEDALRQLLRPQSDGRGGWADQRVTDYGLGLHSSDWRRAGIALVARNVDYLETLEDQTKGD